MLTTVPLDSPAGVTAKLGWDPATTVHDRRRIIAKELIAEKLGCDAKDIKIEREAPRGFGYHTKLIASRDGVELPLVITTASYRAATVVAISDPALPLGIDIRDSQPEPADLARMKKHSHLVDEEDLPTLLHHWVQVQAILEADSRSVRVAAELVHIDDARHKGWLPDRNMKFLLTDASRDSWIITMASGILAPA